MTTPNNDPFAFLYPYQFLVITTFRKDGRAVPTTVWFAPDNGKLYMTTSVSTGKIKRIRNNERVLLAPSDQVGNVLGEQLEARAHELPGAEHEHAVAVLRGKYSEQFDRILQARTAQGASRTYVEIVPS